MGFTGVVKAPIFVSSPMVGMNVLLVRDLTDSLYNPSMPPERHPATHSEAIERIRYLEAFRVIERDRPECPHRRRGSFVEMDRVAVGAVERVASLVTDVERIDRVLGQVGAKTKWSNHCALE